MRANTGPSGWSLILDGTEIGSVRRFLNVVQSGRRGTRIAYIPWGGDKEILWAFMKLSLGFQVPVLILCRACDRLVSLRWRVAHPAPANT